MIKISTVYCIPRNKSSPLIACQLRASFCFMEYTVLILIMWPSKCGNPITSSSAAAAAAAAAAAKAAAAAESSFYVFLVNSSRNVYQISSFIYDSCPSKGESGSCLSIFPGVYHAIYCSGWANHCRLWKVQGGAIGCRSIVLPLKNTILASWLWFHHCGMFKVTFSKPRQFLASLSHF